MAKDQTQIHFFDAVSFYDAFYAQPHSSFLNLYPSASSLWLFPGFSLLLFYLSFVYVCNKSFVLYWDMQSLCSVKLSICLYLSSYRKSWKTWCKTSRLYSRLTNSFAKQFTNNAKANLGRISLRQHWRIEVYAVQYILFQLVFSDKL